MTPEEARRIDREEFEAECAAIRQRAFAHVARRRKEARAEIADWLRSDAPKATFRRYPRKIAVPKPMKPKRPIGQKHTINGVSLTMQEWAERVGVAYGTLAARIHRLGSIEAAVNFQPIENRRPVTVAGKTMSVNAWAGYLGVPSSTLHHRVKRQGNAETVITDLLKNPPGVVSDFWRSEGTGAGAVAQETPNITFSDKAEA